MRSHGLSEQAGGTPLNRFPLVHSDSIEDVQAALARVCVKPRLSPEGGARTFEATFNHRYLERSAIGYSKYGAAFRLKIAETKSNRVVLLVPIAGKCETAIGGTIVDMNSDGCAAVPPGMHYERRADADFESLTYEVGLDVLSNKLSSMTGMPASRTLALDTAQDFVSPVGQVFRNFLMFVVDQLSAVGAPLPALLLTEFEQALMIFLLCGAKHNCRHLFDGPLQPAAAWQVRRTEEFIEAHWNQPITIDALASATCSSARSIFHTFKKSRGYSPMAFAKEVRLRHAKQMLSNPDDQTSVTDVAFACGFGNLSHFARAYCECFGERPSITLNAARGQESR